jgi:ketosteroid isomerase-like protein
VAQRSALEIVSAYQDAWTSKDFDTAKGFLADDIVFHSPQQHIESVTEFISMLITFAERIEPRWEMVAASSEGDNVLILYELFTLSGDGAVCADHFTIRSGKIQSETLVFDPKPFLAARPQ